MEAAGQEKGASKADPRAGARVMHGHDECYAAVVAQLLANGLPGGLLPLDDIEEVGFVEETGYFWVQQKKAKNHTFPLIGKTCHYEKLITGRFEQGRVLDLTGITSKEALVLWLSIVNILTNPDKHPGEVYYKTGTGVGKWLPADAFELPHAPVPALAS